MSASQTANCQTEPSAVPASAGELLELADRLHSCVEQLRAGDTQALTSAALSRLVTDAAHLYSRAFLAAVREIDIPPKGLSATDAGILIAALMPPQNPNTLYL